MAHGLHTAEARRAKKSPHGNVADHNTSPQ
jgi:hypothetical protein